MPSKPARITGWILSGLIGLFLIGASAIPKFTEWPGKSAMMDHLGLPLPLVPVIGTVELLVTVLYLIPRTSFIGAILLTGYLGGAVLTHVRIGDPWFFPLIIGIIAWVGLALRQPLLIGLATGAVPPAGGKAGNQP